MACNHSTILVYEEVTYEATLIDGKALYDPSAPQGVHISECRCIDCDEEFECEAAEIPPAPLRKIIAIDNCMSCFFTGACRGWKQLTAEKRLHLLTCGKPFLLQDCPLQTEGEEHIKTFGGKEDVV